MRKTLLYVIILFQLALIGSLIRGIQSTMSSRERIASLEAKKQQAEEKEKELIKQEEYVQSELYLEKVAREELHLARPGEKVVIIPENSIQLTSGSVQKEEGIGEMPNWRKWWEVLSGRIN